MYNYKQLTRIFGSKSKTDEILLLQNNLKQVVRQIFFPNEANFVEKYCQKNKLHFFKSKFKVIFLDNNQTYSNKGMRIPANDKRDGALFYYISKDEEKALLANYFELINNHYSLGLLLGYPKCCIEYFCKSFSENNPNPTQKDSHLLIDLSKRDQDKVLVSHFPCNPNCQESIKLAQRNLRFLHQIEPKRARELIDN